jgi:biotin transport system substrate-specific component
MYPVPMTMQTFAALVIGMTLGWRRAGAALSVYLLEGAVGLPVFATGGGPAYLLGPTGGYLLGFLVAAVSVGWLAERGWGRTFLTAFLANAMGTATIFSLGVGWLTVVLTTSSSMNASGAFDRALASCLYPFMFGAVVKTVLASVGLPAAWTILGRKH